MTSLVKVNTCVMTPPGPCAFSNGHCAWVGWVGRAKFGVVSTLQEWEYGVPTVAEITACYFAYINNLFPYAWPSSYNILWPHIRTVGAAAAAAAMATPHFVLLINYIYIHGRRRHYGRYCHGACTGFWEPHFGVHKLVTRGLSLWSSSQFWYSWEWLSLLVKPIGAGTNFYVHVVQVIPIKLEDIVDLPTEPYHPQRIQQLAVQCKAQRCYKSQSRQLKNEGEKIFLHIAQLNQHYAPLSTAFSSGRTTLKLLPTALH